MPRRMAVEYTEKRNRKWKSRCYAQIRNVCIVIEHEGKDTSREVCARASTRVLFYEECKQGGDIGLTARVHQHGYAQAGDSRVINVGRPYSTKTSRE